MRTECAIPARANTSVTVSSENTPVIQSESPVRQTNVTERQVKELPLLVSAESAGRTPLAFIFLDSNVASTGTESGQDNRGSNASRFRVSGGQALGTEILIDGAPRAARRTAPSRVEPGPNAFQESRSRLQLLGRVRLHVGGIVNFTSSPGQRLPRRGLRAARNRVLTPTASSTTAGHRRPLTAAQLRLKHRGPVPSALRRGGRTPQAARQQIFFFNLRGLPLQRTETVNLSVTTEMMAWHFSSC